MVNTEKGSCLCGAVGFETSGDLRDVVACHCSQCRKQTGLYYAATNVDDADLQMTGTDNIAWYKASVGAARGFCRNCGSALFWKADGSSHTSIMAGAFDGDPKMIISRHIFCADKASFYDIADGRPQFPQSDS